MELAYDKAEQFLFPLFLEAVTRRIRERNSFDNYFLLEIRDPVDRCVSVISFQVNEPYFAIVLFRDFAIQHLKFVSWMNL